MKEAGPIQIWAQFVGNKRKLKVGQIHKAQNLINNRKLKIKSK
jgi:hypothetical protein